MQILQDRVKVMGVWKWGTCSLSSFLFSVIIITALDLVFSFLNIPRLSHFPWYLLLYCVLLFFSLISLFFFCRFSPLTSQYYNMIKVFTNYFTNLLHVTCNFIATKDLTIRIINNYGLMEKLMLLVLIETLMVFSYLKVLILGLI